ncbi:MAG: hypothetical protein IT445_18510 [Phycisphaeraceae bacterium]|nr:hypothetical protein [Phycisphaeraceae bacterium]
MSQTPTLRRRIATTPMRDWIRGRLTGRMDLRAIYDAADLPEPAKQLVQQVVKRTRLHQLEKVDVARELIAHFQDALESGHSVEQAMADFGDPHHAAKLIRRAKKRNRSIIWKMWARGWQVMGALVVLYVLAAIVLALDKPVVTVDYIAKLNAPIEAVPQQDRAWPDYRQAILALRLPWEKDYPLWVERDPERPTTGSRQVQPSDPQWPAAVAYLREHADALAAIRRGASKPTLGLTVGHEGHWSGDDDLALFGEDHVIPDTSHDSYAEQLSSNTLINVLLPHLTRMHAMSRVMTCDIQLAIGDGDGERAVADIEAIIGMAEQLRPRRILIEQLVGLRLAARADMQLNALLQDHAVLLGSNQWAQQAHHLARLDDWDSLSMEAESWMFEDFVQRIYGHTGRLTTTGMQVFSTYLDQSNPLRTSTDSRLLNTALSPISAAVFAPQDDMLAKFRELIGMLQQNSHQTLREVILQESTFEVQVEQLNRIRYAPLCLLMPGWGFERRTVLQARAARRGTMIAIAAELYLRDTGSYPADLQTLVPRYLPQAYPDESATSGTLLLKVTDGQLTVYGRGLDNDDDGGTPPADYTWPRLDQDQTDGDWVLYPAPPED